MCVCLCVLLHKNIEIDLRHSSHITQEDITTNRICCNMHVFGLWDTNVQTIMVSSTVFVCKSISLIRKILNRQNISGIDNQIAANSFTMDTWQNDPLQVYAWWISLIIWIVGAKYFINSGTKLILRSISCFHLHERFLQDKLVNVELQNPILFLCNTCFN